MQSVHFRVLEVSVVDTYLTKHKLQIKMDCFDSSTVSCEINTFRRYAGVVV